MIWWTKKPASARYEQINNFEEMLSENGVTILKFFLHISKDEQKERLQARLDDPDEALEIQRRRFERTRPVERLSKRL